MNHFIHLLLLLVIVLGGCTTKTTTKAKTEKPNVVIILADDQGWGDFSVNGNSNLNTANIDKMASEGASLDNFYVCPVCSPTRAEMLTGRYHVRGGVYDTSEGGERLDLDETTIANVFKHAGYATAAYGKWHNGMQYPYHPNGRGFDDFYGFCAGHWGNYFSPMLDHNGEIVKGEGFIIDDLTNHGMEFMEENKDKPFLLYLPFNTPHAPMQVPDEYWDRFKDKELGNRSRYPDKEKLQFTKAALAMCENIDWNVGRVMNKIKELGIEDNTIVLYFSDNGPNSWRWNGGMKGKKSSVDEGGVRSPLFVKWPGKIPEGTQINHISGAIDLLPTLAEMAGIELKTQKTIDGISLKPLLFNEGENWPERNIFSYWGNRLSVRNQKFRLDNKGQLFDIENDRGQTKDVGEEYPAVKKELEQAAKYFKKDIASELPEKDERTFTIGHPGTVYSQIPARDGKAHGDIKRSSKWPNCSYFTKWTSIDDKITWDVDVVEEGDFEVILYYTCPQGDEGSIIQLSLGANKLTKKITEPHDPPLRGMENDRIKRYNSYVKDWETTNIGDIHLDKGEGVLTLKTLEKPGKTVMDFRLLMFKRK